MQETSTADPSLCPSFDDLFRDHREGVRRVARRLGAPASAAEDLAQETFIVAHQKLDSYEHRGTGMAWLAQIARHVTLRYLRGRRRETRRLAAIPVPVPDDLTPIDDLVGRASLAESLAECVRTLPHKQQEALQLLEVEDFTGAEVARQLGVSSNTVYSRARLARQKLRRLARTRALD